MSASAKSSAQSAKRAASVASDHEPAIKKAKASKAKKEDGRAASTCKTLCGVVSNHTAGGHNVQLQNEFSISPGDRRNWFLSHVLQGKLQNRVCNCNLAFDVIFCFLVNNQLPPVEFDVMLETSRPRGESLHHPKDSDALVLSSDQCCMHCILILILFAFRKEFPCPRDSQACIKEHGVGLRFSNGRAPYPKGSACMWLERFPTALSRCL